MANKKIKHIIAKLVGSSTEETMDVYDVDAVHTADVINNLTSNTEAAKKKPLSAYQGYVLNNNLSSITSNNVGLLNNSYRQDDKDLNDYKTQGIYYLGSNLTNGPDASGYLYLFVLRINGGNDGIQIAWSVVTSNVYRRRLSGGNTWGAWSRLSFVSY